MRRHPRTDGRKSHSLGKHRSAEGFLVRDEERLLSIPCGGVDGVAEAGADDPEGAEDCPGSTSPVSGGCQTGSRAEALRADGAEDCGNSTGAVHCQDQ